MSSLDLDQPVWYAAYGSNVLEERFLRYIQGGPIPNSTTGQSQDAARDTTLPSGDEPFAIDRQLFFAGSSSRWGDGGVAFLDADKQPDSTVHGRAWRITLGQLEDLFRQENGLSDLVEIDLDALCQVGRLEVVERWYGRLEVVGEIGDLSVVTLATPKPMTRYRSADISYLSVIAQGLIDCWQMELPEIATYLAGLPGNNLTWTADQLLDRLRVQLG